MHYYSVFTKPSGVLLKQIFIKYGFVTINGTVLKFRGRSGALQPMTTLKMEGDQPRKKLAFRSMFSQIIAREDFSKTIRCQSYRSYINSVSYLTV